MSQFATTSARARAAISAASGGSSKTCSTFSANGSGWSASRQNSPSWRASPSAPIRVETTGMPLAKASSSLTRTPEPLRVSFSMQRVALIYNPASGQHSARRKAAVEEAMAVLGEAGIAAEAFVTVGVGSATDHAYEAIRKGCDTILACGGDGTVHEILQSMVGTD